MRKSIKRILFFIRSIQENDASYSQLKHYFKWSASLNPEASSIKDEQPWVTYDVIGFLTSKLNNKSVVFEYGGGGSTLFFVKRVQEVVTVEHDKSWFEILSQIIKDKNYSNWKGSFKLPQMGDLVDSPSISKPEHYSSDDDLSIGYNFKDYASFIDSYPDNYFDIVLVDGRARPSCLKHSIDKIKKGGLLILDNSNRKYYLEDLKETIKNNFETVIDNTGPSPYTESFTKTTVWRKK